MKVETGRVYAGFSRTGEVEKPAVPVERQDSKQLSLLPRMLAVVVTLLGLATLPIHLIATNAPAPEQTRLSPFQLMIGLLADASHLGVLTMLPSMVLPVLGMVFVYLALFAILLATLAVPSRRFILVTAVLGAVAAVGELLPGFPGPLCGTAAMAVCGQAMHAGVWLALLLSTLGVLVAIAGAEELTARFLVVAAEEPVDTLLH